MKLAKRKKGRVHKRFSKSKKTSKKYAPKHTSNKLQKKRKVITKKSLYAFSWDDLSAHQKVERNQALEVLRRMRRGVTLKKASKEVGLSIKSAKSHIGGVLYKKRGKWLAKLEDTLQRCMVIYDKDKGKITITVKNSEDAASIGVYLSLVNIALNEGKERVFRRLSTKSIRDVFGKRYRFETNLNRLYEIQDEIEDDEFFQIYNDE